MSTVDAFLVFAWIWLVFELGGIFRALHLQFSISVLTSYFSTDFGKCQFMAKWVLNATQAGTKSPSREDGFLPPQE